MTEFDRGKNSNRSKSGFTIIEVVLVLAIGGLIFLMVFIALPALQQSQRNTQRREDMSRVMTAIVAYQKNNHGKIPLSTTGKYDTNFVNRYLDSNCEYAGKDNGSNAAHGAYKYNNCSEAFTDPDGEAYMIAHLQTRNDHGDRDISGWIRKHYIYIAPQTKCVNNNGNYRLLTNGGKNNFSLYYLLEGGAIYCADNSDA